MTAHSIVLIVSQGNNTSKSSNKAGDLNAESVARAVQVKKNDAAKAKREAESEEKNMEKALAYASKQKAKQAPQSIADMLGPLRKPDVEDVTQVAHAQDGQLVDVEPHLGRKGPARHGGLAKVVEVSGVGGNTVVDVQYIIGGSFEGKIDIGHFTKAPPAGFAKPPPRAAKGRPAYGPPPPPPPSLHPLMGLSLKEALLQACRACRKEGWRREMFYGKKHLLKRMWTAAEKRRPVSEYKEMKAYEDGAGAAKHAQRNSTSGGQFVTRTTQHNAHV